MDNNRSTPQPTKRRTVAVLTIAGLAALAIGVLPSAAHHGLPHPELLARGAFTDDVGATVKSKLDGRGTRVVNVRDASDLVVLKITIEAGGIAPWHAHSGPGLLVNIGPGTFTSILSDDCIARDYKAGEALVDPGGRTLHAGRNDSDHEVVLYAIFLGTEGAPVLPAREPPADCDVLS
jgi:quercetin dioxygenase-like cupin family protein